MQRLQKSKSAIFESNGADLTTTSIPKALNKTFSLET